jgi:DNA-binding NarL/FixJ family response regulator
MPAPRVVIADDHPPYRHGLAKLLTAAGIDVVAEAGDGRAAVEAVERTAPDVAILDLDMPALSGLEATRRLAERMPASRVLILSVSAEELDVNDAIRAGASGYFLKDGPVEDVVAGIRDVASGEFVSSPRIASMLRRPRPE